MEEKHHSTRPAGNTFFNTAQGVFNFLCHLAHIQLVRQDAQVLLYKEEFQLCGPQPVAVHRIIFPKVQNFARSFAKLQDNAVGRFLRSAKFPLDSSPTVWCYQLQLHFVTSTNLQSVCSAQSSKSLRKMLNNPGPSLDPSGMPVTDSS